MFGLYISLAGLGLAAIDPIGIGIMPVLLIQRRPYQRAAVFLSGSFAALMVMGIVFAKGLGNVVLRFENHNHWFVPAIEALGGLILLAIAITIGLKLRHGSAPTELTSKTQTWLKLNNTRLFIYGAILVAVQSVIDVVFVVAMVRVGQLQLSDLELTTAAAIYALAALVLQIVVVITFRLAPPRQKVRTLQKVHDLLGKYSNLALMVVSLVLALVLFALALHAR